MRVRTCRRGLLMSCAGMPTLHQAMPVAVLVAEAPPSVTQQVLHTAGCSALCGQQRVGSATSRPLLLLLWQRCTA